MAAKASNPLILRLHRLIDVFAKSDDERDFYLDRQEGFILFVDLNKTEQELELLREELTTHKNRYVEIPKLTFYEIKKIMEGFVNEKVYDIDTKEKLLDIIQSKDARDNFLEFIYDHLTELEKWQQYYQERARIRIIEWLRNHDLQFVFEEDLEMECSVIEKVKQHFFSSKVPKDVQQGRDAILSKAKTYYSTEALNPRPRRGRPPKQIAKVEIEPQISKDLYSTVAAAARPFLYIPAIASPSAITFSSKYESEEEFLVGRHAGKQEALAKWDSLATKIAALKEQPGPAQGEAKKIDWSQDDDDEEEEETPKPKSSRKPMGKPLFKPIQEKGPKKR